MSADPFDRVRDMLTFARAAVDIASGRPAHEIAADELSFYALRHVLMLIGEAANQTPVVVRAQVLDIPWRRVIDLRHRLAHGYRDIDVAVLVEVVRVHIPPLIAALERALKDDAP